MRDSGGAGSAVRVRQLLADRGVPVNAVAPLPGDGRGSHPWRVTTADGRDLFVKLSAGRQRDAGRLRRWRRRLRYRHLDDEPAYRGAVRKTGHEACLLRRARLAGVRVPRLLAKAAGPAGEGLIVEEFVPGRPLDTLHPDELGADALADVWRQVALLHRAGLAHRDLRGANVLVTDSTARLVALAAGTDRASPEQRARDLVEPLVTLAGLAGVRPTVAAAVDHLGAAAVADSLPWLQPALLSRPARQTSATRPGLLDDLRAEIAHRCPGRPVRTVRVVRFTGRGLFLLVMLGVLGYLLVAESGQFALAVRALGRANPAAVTGTLLAAAATYPLSALALRLAAAGRIPLGTTVSVQVASAFVNRVAPGAVGGFALTLRYLRRKGLPLPVAATAVAVDRVAGVLAVAVLLPVLLPFARGSTEHLRAAVAGRGWVVLLVGLGLLVLAGIAIGTPRWRARARHAGRQALDALRSLARSGRVARLLTVDVALTLAYATALWLSLLAVGLPAEPALVAPVVLVSVVGEGVSTAAPTPGGLGATEAALVSGLLLYGVPAGTAVAGVLIYRLATFWLPVLPGYVALRLLVRRRAV
ncbi:lysylphosphatidylglycerol synthase domain-containing protein [Micromonospora narathiwatensis]|uniref:Undecaprenyl-diphosphatase n=1 Tax=Micromonospora narathiwatensis TaxID=299146 RepID=A0A1A8ZF36_9ACTN|nr:lysylphosphatidylglycerol synthase domain-containing protein [Micromonospora narathiwatensis]SBT42490.1 undecaprenyl-diphosphatase [Micromonospora narathiwatensis]